MCVAVSQTIYNIHQAPRLRCRQPRVIGVTNVNTERPDDYPSSFDQSRSLHYNARIIIYYCDRCCRARPSILWLYALRTFLFDGGRGLPPSPTATTTTTTNVHYYKIVQSPQTSIPRSRVRSELPTSVLQTVIRGLRALTTTRDATLAVDL